MNQLKKGPFNIKREQSYLDSLNEIDEIEMPILMDSIEVWRIVKNKPELQHKLSEVEEMCLDSLKSYWGDDAKIQFNNDLSVRCMASDGKLLILENKNEK